MCVMMSGGVHSIFCRILYTALCIVKLASGWLGPGSPPLCTLYPTPVRDLALCSVKEQGPTQPLLRGLHRPDHLKEGLKEF